jgi:hypothetical protein
VEENEAGVVDSSGQKVPPMSAQYMPPREKKRPKKGVSGSTSVNSTETNVVEIVAASEEDRQAQ